MTYNGCSLVDYTLVSTDLLQGVSRFTVNNLTELSDHSLIYCSLFTCFYDIKHKDQLDPLPGKFIWNKEAIENYKANLLSEKIKHKLQDFLINKNDNCELAVETFNSILQETATMSAKFVKSKILPIKKKKKACFSDSCHELRNTVRSYLSLVNKYPYNGEYRKKYYSFLSKYRRKCKSEEKKYKQKICDDIYSNMSNDPKTFWNMINKLNNKSMINEENFNKEEFIQFFEKINNHSDAMPNTDFHRHIEDKVNKFINNIDEPQTVNKTPYDDPIKPEEITKAIKTLKNGKSTANDLISNEMLKHGTPQLLEPLTKLFNLVFSKGHFPKKWNESFISLIHKKGDKNNPSNYRGISLTSNLGKLFNKILLNRLTNFINQNNIIYENQIGFKEKARTTDHIFTMKSIVDTYKCNKKKVFAAFIDLKKAFDTVWRDGLFYKLQKNNIPAQIFKIIYSMYRDPCCKIKFKQGLSRSFISKCGVKQGDILSPILFNLYINDLVTKLNKTQVDPIKIGNASVSSLLYADDIILLSNTESGLQKSLDLLSDFCSSWKLEVNNQKSKVIIFNSNGKTYLNSFKINGTVIETVKSYCYLGITLKYTGNINISAKLLMEKGRKAWFKIKKTLGLDNPCKLLEKLFDTLISPIILYGCEIWGAHSNLKDTEPFEHLHIKFIKEILGVHSKASNVTCLSELNRNPLKNKIKLLSIKFLDHISNSTNTLVNKIYINLPQSNKWILTIKTWIRELGFGYLIDNTNNLKRNISCIKQRLNDQSLQNQHSTLIESKKLSFYRSIHKSNQRPYYVDICKFKTDRSTICKYRISAHSLEIEKGRYKNIPQSARLCTKCESGQVEDELHFFIKCPKYNIYRQELNNKLKCELKNFNYLTENKLCLILNSSSLVVLKAIIEFINKCQINTM